MLLSKNRVIRRRAVVGLLVAASLMLLTASYREGSSGAVGSVQRTVVSVTAPFATAAHRVTRPFVDGWHWTTGLIHARNQTAQLKILQTKLGQATSKIRQLEAQNAQYQADAHWVESHKQFKSVSGSVFLSTGGGATGGASKAIEIGIGSANGVAVKDAVVAPTSDGGGLVGLVTQVTSSTALVQVLLDPQAGVTAEVQGEQGAFGTVVPATGSPGQLSLIQVPGTARVRNGDTVVTTGANGRLGSLYPDGIPIGLVEGLKLSDQSGTATYSSIQVTPFVDFGSLDSVIVLETH
jgi:rod shape-determining protein MreC